ncbi:Rv0361 family membrane protein [Hoyosella subflava]|uniref:Uncharacterized protein n=1 Tax=Hoyosella subflava (strain DSM 45089 / JCM 17490 / NBRC 109087 / DQS3-9A1) TaxID=443218 RepID=F6EHF0_HOYSD|nr:DUF4878 domain-containing protein [Hoyosella subflava]AEF41129.1 hypothetical protein AS9A_2682 [Hoyosella subflava DQS3-9A1]
MTMRSRFSAPARRIGAGVAASALIAGSIGLAGSGLAGADTTEEDATDQEITEALSSYLDAANSFDYEGFVAATCEPEVEFMNELIGKLMNGADLEAVWDRAQEVRGEDAPQIEILDITDIVVEGDNATATVTTQLDEREPTTETVELVLDEEAWKVCPDRSEIDVPDEEETVDEATTSDE